MEKKIQLFDILWEDILIPYVIPHLSIDDLFNLSLCSMESREFVNLALKSLKKCELYEKHQDFLPTIARNCTNLTNIGFDSDMKFNKHWITILENNPNLVVLEICRFVKRDYCEWIDYSSATEEQLISIFQILPQLKDVKGNLSFTEEVVLAIIKNCRNIQRLRNIPYSSSYIYRYLIDDCPSLQFLELNIDTKAVGGNNSELENVLKNRGVEVKIKYYRSRRDDYRYSEHYESFAVDYTDYDYLPLFY